MFISIVFASLISAGPYDNAFNQYQQQPNQPYVAPHYDNGGFHNGGVVPPNNNNGFQGGYEAPHYETPHFDNGGFNRPYDTDE